MKNQNSAGKRKKPTKLVSAAPKVTIHKMPTGVRGLDEILGGGIPEFSFNIIAGTPGCGKTTLAHQIIFANATIKKPAIYFTVLGEPALKMLRYQQQYSFFDASKVGKAIRFINLSDVVLGKNLDAVLDEIIQQVTTLNPSVVVVDSFRTVVRKAMADESEMMTALRRLPRRQREVLVLRYYADLDVAEIATTLRIGASTVRSTISRGLASLSRALEGEQR